VDQLDHLSAALSRRPPGRLLLVTDGRHMPRALAVARILMGPLGIRVAAVPSLSTAEVNAARRGRRLTMAPEGSWRRVRDQIRAHICRTPIGCLPR
jgi:uncharacterized SAM-binding protein YcdF (DUF218 family)